MGEPAFALPPAEEVAAREAARQTTRLVALEGGKAAAARAGGAAAAETVEAVAAESLASRIGLGLLGGIGIALSILLWPSTAHAPELATGSEPKPKPDPVPDPNPSAIKPCPFPRWEPSEGFSHPDHEEVDAARRERGPDCHDIGMAIDILVRDLKFRRWDMARYGPSNPRYAGHRDAYYERREDLRRLVALAKKLPCPYNPEADIEVNRRHDYPTPSY